MLVFAMLSRASGGTRIMDIPLAENVSSLTWWPKFPHTIVLFPQDFDSAIKMYVVGAANIVTSTISTDKSVFGINFGSDASAGLQFVATTATTIRFFVYEPRLYRSAI
jgi:hypothetical protein